MRFPDFAARLPIFALLVAASLASGCAFLGGEAEAPSGAAAVPHVFPRPFQIIGHRGAAGHAPENTLAAVRAARALGVVEVELDTQLTRDDRVVLFHDGTLAAKTGHPSRVRDLTLAELTQLDIGAWFDATHPEAAQRFAGTRVDSLESVFAEMGRALFYHVELKDEEPGLAAAVLRQIDRFELRDRVIVTSFHFEQLERMQALEPALPLCLLIDHAGRRTGPVEEWISRAARADFAEVGVAAPEITPEQVAFARERGLWIRAWRIRNDEDMERAIAVGSHGMTIDWPEKLIRRLLEHEGSPGALR